MSSPSKLASVFAAVMLASPARAATMLLVQMALGADPELLRAQASLAFAGLTGAVMGPLASLIARSPSARSDADIDAAIRGLEAAGERHVSAAMRALGRVPGD